MSWPTRSKNSKLLKKLFWQTGRPPNERQSRIKFAIIHEMTSRPNNLLNISTLCQIADVSRSGYYNWLASKPLRWQREQNDKEDFGRILEAYHFRGYAKGARSIHMRMLHQNPPVLMNIKKIRRLMHKFALRCPIRKANPYRRMAKALKTSYVAPNLLNREFREHGPRKVLLTDITYVPYASNKRSYLSTILDAYTKQLLAYAFSPSLEVDFVLQTVENLIRDHGISLDAETLVNSDQGAHYTSYKFVRLLKDSGLRQSMSRRANSWDNAPQESLFGHMKDEIDLGKCQTHEQAAALIDDWIDYYNMIVTNGIWRNSHRMNTGYISVPVSIRWTSVHPDLLPPNISICP